MPRVSKFFGSTFLTAADLADGERQLIISGADEIEVWGEPKLIVYFQDEDKG